MTGRYLLCRPTGGLTDMLSQIGRCIEYAKNHRRRLIIDTDIQDFFSEPLSNHFLSSHHLDATVNPGRALISRLNERTCRPAGIRGRLTSYRAQQISVVEREAISQRIGHFTNLEDSTTQEPLSFDFRIDHPEELLVHHCSGNHLQSALVSMQSLWPLPELRRSVIRRLQKLPEKYDALHIRHTDLVSDLASAIKSVGIHRDIPLLISTDSHSAAREVIKKIRFRPVVFASKPLNPADFGHSAHATTHKDAAKLPRHDINKAAFIDLICLARARTLISAPLIAGQCKATSGYFELAKQLWQSPHFISRFIV